MLPKVQLRQSPLTLVLQLDYRFATIELGKHLPAVQNQIATKKEVWALEELNEAPNDRQASFIITGKRQVFCFGDRLKINSEDLMHFDSTNAIYDGIQQENAL